MKSRFQTALELYHNDINMKHKGLPLNLNLERFDGPSYVIYRNLIRNRMSAIKENLDDSIKIHFAIKANPNVHLVELMSQITDGFDLASGKELNLALNTGINPEHVSMAGPGKSQQELRAAAMVRATVNIESARELGMLRDISEELGFPCPIALRINVPFETKGFGLKMGGSPRQFGIDWEQVPELVQTIKDYQLDFKGLHLFSGSQNLDAKQITSVQEQSYELARSLSQKYQLPMKKVNLGGGLGIPYYTNDKAIDLPLIKAKMNDLAEKARKDFDDTILALELGRFLVGEAGIYVCDVVDLKTSGGINFVITNGGLHHHLLATGNFGQVIRRNFPIKVLGKTGAERSYRVTGLLCTPLDIFASDILLPELEIGDKIIIFQSGAYGKTSSPSGFLSHPEVNEFLL